MNYALPISAVVIIVILVGIILALLIWRKDREKENEFIRDKNRQAEEEYDSKQELIKILEDNLNQQLAESSKLTTAIVDKKERLDELWAQRSKLEKELNALSETINKTKGQMDKSVEDYAETISQQLQKVREDYDIEYQRVLSESAEEYRKAIETRQAELNELDEAIDNAHQILLAILQEKQREQDDKTFYTLNLHEGELEEIKKLREVSKYLRDPEPLNKVIWTVYYRTAYQALITRLFGAEKPCGIYKITSLLDDKVYIGQSVNVPNRFSEHIKRGIGAEPATRNKLYPEMKRIGVENFRFELLEEVPREKLDEREKFWIAYYKSADYGFNATRGNGGQ